MNSRFIPLLILVLLTVTLPAADLPPDKGNEIPESSKRPVVVTLEKSQLSSPQFKAPLADLPDAWGLQVIAAPPLVNHPMLACLDDRGRLFVCDAVGANWNKKQLEANPPNRVLMLEDTDGDGIYDKSTVFADHMTFPQGACWLNGSLYVCSPPGLWKLTDTQGTGVADQREQIVTGFDYTGNAADVHGPWLHPNGRLYWCHGRKGHQVVGKDGKVVHEGLASGIWSCKPDGTDVQWHSLGCGDNPVKVDFTPEGEIIGVQNLYYSGPRGDAIVHWLYGGVYERADQMKAIADLPRTLEHMPVMYNFGHVAVGGCCFWPGYSTNMSSPSLQLMVAHFNTQRVVRMDLTPDGVTYKATENEFLKLHDPDVHLTDVIVDHRDGSLLVMNTGGWFRIGCPASLMAKPDIMGAIYRAKRKLPAITVLSVQGLSGSWKQRWELNDEKEVLTQLKGDDAKGVMQACDWATEHPKAGQAIRSAVVELLGQPATPSLEHAILHAAISLGKVAPLDFAAQKQDDVFTSRCLIVLSQTTEGSAAVAPVLRANMGMIGHDHPLITRAVIRIASSLPDGCDVLASDFGKWLEAKNLQGEKLNVLTEVASEHLATPEAQKLVASMLSHPSAAVRGTALQILADQTSGVVSQAWLPLLDQMLATSKAGELSPVIDAVKKLKDTRFDEKLQAIANDTKQPLSLRLKALDAMKGLKLTSDTFALLQNVLTHVESSAAARIQAAGMLAHAPLKKDQLAMLAPVLASVGPLEMKPLLALVNKCGKDVELARTVSLELAKNPVIGSEQESTYRTAFSSQPPELFETIILPALRKANEVNEAKMRQLAPLAEKVISHGDPKAGRLLYESGKSVCIACHQIGDKGRAIGPNLSHIGAIRTERDILESIIFPSNTLARDYETHVIETSDGQSIMGVIKSHTAEGFLMVDAAGQEKSIPDTQIVANTQLTTSLMPMGLDQALNEKELCDLVAWLRSLK